MGVSEIDEIAFMFLGISVTATTVDESKKSAVVASIKTGIYLRKIPLRIAVYISAHLILNMAFLQL